MLANGVFYVFVFVLHHNGSVINIVCKKYGSFLQYVKAFTNSVIARMRSLQSELEMNEWIGAI